MASLREMTDLLLREEETLRLGGGADGQQRQRRHGRLPVRERLALLLDRERPFLEFGIWAAHGMYPEWGETPAAGIVSGLGWVSGRPCLIAANDGTVKAGAMFPQSVKKLLRLQRMAFQFRLPVIYLVDSAGVFLPLQDEVFPDEDDFGRIFRNNAVLSAAGVPQYAAVMGNCIAGGAYLPVLCDKLLMTDGSQMCLAGPALVKAAIGQDVDPEELGGAAMHAAISGTVDFREPDDPSCLRRLRSLVGLLPGTGRRSPNLQQHLQQHLQQILPQRGESAGAAAGGEADAAAGGGAGGAADGGAGLEAGGEAGAADMPPESGDGRAREASPARQPDELYAIVPADGRGEYDVRDVLDCLVDLDTIQEYKAEFGQSLVTAFARIGGHSVGIVANQKRRRRSADGELQMGGVLYPDAADKAARFVMDCNQIGAPIVFVQDVQGFMVGKQAEQAGIIRAGAKLVNVVSNSIVPKLTVIIGGSFGAGHYAMCGKAYDPLLILAWPSAKYAVMGADQAAETLLALQLRDAERAGRTPSDAEIAELRQSIRSRYEEQTGIRYGAARGWVDAIIAPHQTRLWLKTALDALPAATSGEFKTGVMQV